jgi:hypothetical protein
MRKGVGFSATPTKGLKYIHKEGRAGPLGKEADAEERRES